MPVHDWTCVEAGIFHDFHYSWITHIKEVLNAGLLPSGYYAMAEQHASEIIPDVLALHAPSEIPPISNGQGGIGVLDAPPKVTHKYVGLLRQPKTHSQRQIAIRHVSQHRIVALIEIVSPANKDRRASVKDFASKALSALDLDVHLLIVDLFPPGKHDPRGIQGAIWKWIGEKKITPPTDRHRCALSCVAKSRPEVYLEWFNVGKVLPDMPLFLEADRYVNVPLDATYQTAYAGVPAFWRNVIELGGKV